jgi:hypothetical protein
MGGRGRGVESITLEAGSGAILGPRQIKGSIKTKNISRTRDQSSAVLVQNRVVHAQTAGQTGSGMKPGAVFDLWVSKHGSKDLASVIY